MKFTTSFFAILLASSSVLAAPVPAPAPTPSQALSADALVQQAKGDPMLIVQQFKPVAEQIAATLAEMITVDGTTTPSSKTHEHNKDAAHAHAHHDAATPATPSTPAAAKPDANTNTPPAAEQKHDPAGGVADPNAATASPTDSPATPPAAADPAAAGAAGAVQKRSEDGTHASAPAPTGEAHHEHPHTHPDGHSKEHKDHKEHKEHKDHKDHKHKAAKTPVGHKIHTENVKKLRDLMAKANMYQEAIERVVLNNDQSIEKMPSDKNPKGVAWGLANAPVLAFGNMFNFSKQL